MRERIWIAVGLLGEALVRMEIELRRLRAEVQRRKRTAICVNALPSSLKSLSARARRHPGGCRTS